MSSPLARQSVLQPGKVVSNSAPAEVGGPAREALSTLVAAAMSGTPLSADTMLKTLRQIEQDPTLGGLGLMEQAKQIAAGRSSFVHPRDVLTVTELDDLVSFMARAANVTTQGLPAAVTADARHAADKLQAAGADGIYAVRSVVTAASVLSGTPSRFTSEILDDKTWLKGAADVVHWKGMDPKHSAHPFLSTPHMAGLAYVVRHGLEGHDDGMAKRGREALGELIRKLNNGDAHPDANYHRRPLTAADRKADDWEAVIKVVSAKFDGNETSGKDKLKAAAVLQRWLGNDSLVE